MAEYVSDRGWIRRSCIPPYRVEIESLPNGRCVYLDSEPWEERQVHDPDGTIWLERRRPGDAMKKAAAEAPTLFAAPEAKKPTPAEAKAPPEAKQKPEPKDAQQQNPKREAKPKQDVATVVPIRKDTPANTLMVIAEALKLPDFKPENMRALLDMHKEMVAEQARLDFIGSFHEMKRELPVINRDGRIVIVAKDSTGKRPESGGRVQQSTPYATFENISRQIDPVLDRHGFCLSHSVEPEPGGARIVVTSLLEHVSGHSRVSRFPLPAETSGSKNNVQGWGSAISYGKRYGTIMLLNIRTSAPEDRDTDGHRPKMTKGGKPQVIEGEVIVENGRTGPSDNDEPKIDQKQEDQLRELLEAASTKATRFCEVYAIKALSALPAELFDEAVSRLKAHAEKIKK